MMDGHNFLEYFAMSQRDVAKEFEVSQQSVQKIEKRAMESFREIFNAKGLEFKDFL
jgi:DNA-directed RNA polymerase sigma subunit (sigma70/sigma32)